MFSGIKMPSQIVFKKRKFSGLTFTLAVTFLVLAVIVLTFASTIYIYFNIQTQQESISEQQHLIAEGAANTVKSFIQEKFSILKTGASLNSMATADQNQQKIILEKLLGIEPSFRQLIILDERNNELLRISRLSSFARSQVLENVKPDLFSYLSLEELYVSPVYIDDITNEPMVLMAVPVKNALGDTKGILAAETNLKFMWDMVTSIKVGNSGLAYVVDREGNLIAFSDISRVLRGENLAYLYEVNEFVKGDESDTDSADVSEGIMGNQVVTNHARLETPDWAVVVELPVVEAYGSIMNNIILMLGIIALSILVAVLGGIYLSRRITKPIIRLRDAAIKIGQGVLDTEIEIKSSNEIGELAASLNQMSVNLKKSQGEIEKHAADLEERVKERTKNLDEKMAEMAETKAALLNMMEDSDDTNKSLVSAQGQLKQSMTKLEEIDAKKDQFISIAAHELKTPLTSIHGFSQLLQDDKIAVDREKRAKYLSIIDSETKRLATLVTDILDLSRVDLGTIKLMPSEVDINETMSNIQKEMNVQITQKGLLSEYVIEKNLPKLYTDKERFIQILMNLINNSVKYTPKGKITVKAARERDFIHFSIKDTGIGIAKENHGHIFERFYQVDSSYTRKAGGTGLGLSLCKEFIERMGGKIWFESDIGRGSEFHFTIPVKAVLKAPKNDLTAKNNK